MSDEWLARIDGFGSESMDENDPMNGLGEWGEQDAENDDDESDEAVRLRDNY